MTKTLNKSTMYYLLHLIAKATELKKDDMLGEYFAITKDAAAAIEAVRFEQGVSEKAVAEALGVNPDDYLSFVETGKGLEISAAGIKAVAKLFKMTVEDLAAKMVTGDPEPDASPAAGDSTNPGTEPGQVDPTKAKTGAASIDKSTPALKSGQIRIVEPADRLATDIEKSGTPEQKLALLKMKVVGIRKDITDVRKDDILPSDFAPSGILQPEFSRDVINLIPTGDTFLSSISRHTLGSKKQSVPIDDLHGRNFKRLPVGFAATGANRSKGTTTFLNFDCNQIDIEVMIRNDAIAYHLNDRASLENEIFNNIINACRNDLKDLAINGTLDSTDEEELVWTELGIGFLKLADTLCPAGQKIAVGADPVQTTFKKLREGQLNTNERFYSEDQVLLCGHVDFSNYVNDLNARTDGLTTIIGSQEVLRNYNGHKIIPTTYMTSKNMLFTKLDNLALAIVGSAAEGVNVGRFVVPGGILYRITMYVDFGIKNPKACAVAKA